VLIALNDNGNLLEAEARVAIGWHQAARFSMTLSNPPRREPFLRIPPFPGARVDRFRPIATRVSDDVGGLVDQVRRQKAGGTYWAAQPDLPDDYVLVRPSAALEAARTFARGKAIVHWLAHGALPNRSSAMLRISGECDPWHMLASAAAVVLEPDDEIRSIAAIIGVPAHLYDAASGTLSPDTATADEMLAGELAATFEDPFTGEPITASQVIDLCAFAAIDRF